MSNFVVAYPYNLNNLNNKMLNINNRVPFINRNRFNSFNNNFSSLTFRRRRINQQRNRNRFRARILRGISAYQQMVNHKWVFDEQVELAVGATYDAIFRANSMQRPYTAAVTHRPMGFDQWAGLYYEYRVIGSKITIKFVGQDINQRVVQVGLGCSSNAGAFTNLSYAQEQANFVGGYLGWPQNPSASSVLQAKFSARKWTRSKVMSNEDLEVSAADASVDGPTEAFWYHLLLQNDDDTNAITVRFQVEIEYCVIWFDPKAVPQSDEPPVPGGLVADKVAKQDEDKLEIIQEEEKIDNP